MKALIITSLLLSTTAFAQNYDVNGFKNLLTSKQAILENVNAGMTKKIVTEAKVETTAGVCNYTQTSTQTILKIDGTKMFVLAKESFTAVASDACSATGYENYEETILFSDAKPTLAEDLKDLEASAAGITSILKEGEFVTVKLNASETQEDGTVLTDALTFKYDLTKSSFNNITSVTGKNFATTATTLANVDVNTLDLSDVLFCDNNDGDNSECEEGDYSDILW